MWARGTAYYRNGPTCVSRVLETHRPKQRSNKAASPKKRFGRRAFFWTGIILCVAAVLGVFFWATSAKILQKPITVNYGPDDPAFAVAMGPVVNAEFLDGNKVEILVNGVEFFPAMLRAIREAKKTITLETYIWTPGKISDEFIGALTERARAGVKVHIIIDGMGTLKFTEADRERLKAAGVEFFKYGRQHWWDVKPNINHRTHRKILVVDGRIGFTGGMCIDDSWLGDAESEKVWRETMVRLEGPVVRQMQAAFATNWLKTTTALLTGDDYFPKISSAGSILANCYKSGPRDGPEHARLGYLFAIASARKTIDIANAYFVPDDLAIETLLQARKRGVRIRIVAPAINDSRFGRAASRSRWGRLLEAGVEFYLYQPAMYHAKTMVVDDFLVAIGSANFDNRSFSINDEIMANLLDRGVAAKHRTMFERDVSRSRALSFEEFKSRPFYIKAADHFAGLFRSQL